MNHNHSYRMYLIYAGATAFFFALMGTVSSVYFIQTIHLHAFQLLMVGFTLETTIFVLQIPTGVVADLFSRKLSMGIGLCLMGLGFGLEGLVPTFVAVLLAQVLWGAGYTFVSGADNAWIADELGTDRLERVFLRGTQVSQACTLVGIVVSVIIANVELSLPMVISGILFVLFAGYVWLTFPETRTPWTNDAHPATWGDTLRTVTEGFRVVRTSQVLILLTVIGLLSGLYSEGFDRLWTLHLLSQFTFPATLHLKDITWFGIIAAVALIMNIAVQEWLERQFLQTGKVQKVWVLFALNLCLSAGIVAFAVSHQLWGALFAYLACQVFRGTNNPLYNALVNEQIEGSAYRATILSTQEQLYALGEICGGPLVGLVAASTSVIAGLITSGLIVAPIVVLYIVVANQLKRRTLTVNASPTGDAH